MTTMTPMPYSPVRDFVMHITASCNVRCRYCFVEKNSKKMSLKTALDSVSFILDREISGTLFDININFFGGEPLLELDLIEQVIAHARQLQGRTYKNVHFFATTNGTIFNAQLERILKDGPMELLVSMDGGQQATSYRPFVSGRSSFKALCHNLPRLVECSPSLIVRMTFHPESLDFVGNVQQALDLGAPSVALCPVVEADWEPHQDKLEVAYQALAAWYIESARGGHLLPLDVFHIYLRSWHAYERTGRRPDLPCGVARSILAVDPDGHVMPCHRFLYRPQDWLGTVDSHALSDNRAEFLHLATPDILGCDGCVAQGICGGGCRLIALNAGQGLHGTVPGHCITMRALARAVQTIYRTLMDEGNPALIRFLRAGGRSYGARRELITR